MLVTKALPHDVALLAFVPPPETQINSIIHSFKSHESSVHGTFLYTFLSFQKKQLSMSTIAPDDSQMKLL
ncbi:hypothetical protein [Psychrobacillus antarcticus]|uniref:hypothetical protein n=1 Tax=Psychrobacillus antarcticus TaxID=2879115 RepID=UPI002407D269|nr:hypothetical protein [Psychrobacillus antarcticus]